MLKIVQLLAKSQRVSDIEKKWSTSVQKLLYDWHWKENLKHKEIATRMEVPRPTVTRWFRYFNIPAQPCTRFTNLNLLNVGERKTPPAKAKIEKEFPWKFDKNFFDKWSPKMAYVLGFMAADGYVFTNKRGSHYMGFCSTDRVLIERIKFVIKSNHTIGRRKRKGENWKPLYVLQIGSKEVVNNLRKFGIVQNKSLVIRFPSGIPNEFLGHFVRGYFDGDGSVYFKQHWSKERQKMIWIFSSRFTSGSKPFLASLHKVLRQHISGGVIQRKKRGYELVFSRRDSRALSRIMYNDLPNDLFLARKYKIFKKAISTLRMGP